MTSCLGLEIEVRAAISVSLPKHAAFSVCQASRMQEKVCRSLGHEWALALDAGCWDLEKCKVQTCDDIVKLVH